MKRLLFYSAMAMLADIPPALAKDPVFVVSKPVSDKPAVTLDPSLGYVLLRADVQTPMHLMRLPSAQDQQAYDAMRSAALQKEKKKYPGKVTSYKSDLATYELLKKNNKSLKPPEPPIEPTEENFVFTPFNLLAGASIGPMNRFSKGENGKSVYLQSITPGTYRIYGLLSVAPGQAAVGTCFCMGSVKFTVKAGEIVDLGSISRVGSLIPFGADDEIDPRLRDWPISPADYRAVGKLPNYFGLTLGRITPIAMVIRYNRDRIIDLAAEQIERPVAGNAAPSDGSPDGM